MPTNNYTVEMGEFGSEEVYVIFDVEVPSTDSLYAGRVTICNNVAANHPALTTYSKNQAGADIGPRKKPH